MRTKVTRISILFNLFSILSLIGGIIGAIILRPEANSLDKPLAYFPSFSVLVSGLIFASLFSTLISIQKSLQKIENAFILSIPKK